MNLNPEEADIIYTALAMRRNYIETGDAMMDSAAAERKKMPFKKLEPSQLWLLVKINDLMDRCLKRGGEA